MVLEDRRFQLETEEMLARAVALRALAAELSPEIEEVSRAVQIYEDRVSRATVGTSEYAEAQRDLWSAQDRLAELERRRAEAMADATVTQSEATARTSEATSQINSMGDAVEAAIERWRRMSGANKGFYEQISDAIVDSMEAANRSFGTFVRDVASGTKSIGESFRDMATSIIQSLLEIAAQRAATAIFDDILGMVGIGGGGSSGGGRRSSNQTGGGGIGGLISGGFNFLSGLFNDGGYIRANQGRYIPTRDSVPVLARPGEYILRNSAVEAIGRDNLDTINAMGNRVISGSSQSIQSPLGNQSGEGGVVNVWIVSPDEKPQLGPRDIIAVVNDEIARNGSTKRLIQSIRT